MFSKVRNEHLKKESIVSELRTLSSRVECVDSLYDEGNFHDAIKMLENNLAHCEQLAAAMAKPDKMLKQGASYIAKIRGHDASST